MHIIFAEPPSVIGTTIVGPPAAIETTTVGPPAAIETTIVRPPAAIGTTLKSPVQNPHFEDISPLNSPLAPPAHRRQHQQGRRRRRVSSATFVDTTGTGMRSIPVLVVCNDSDNGNM